jgi:lipoprotein-anchoring transpeptidase ErfK/SrfK
MRIATVLAALLLGAGAAPALGFEDYGDATEPQTLTVNAVATSTSFTANVAVPSQADTAGATPQTLEMAIPGPMLREASPAPLIERALPPLPVIVARIDLSSQSMHVSIAGTPRHTWAISSGRAGYATPRGSFQPQWTSRMWYSRKYDYAPMPHAVFFNGGVAVHATSATRMLGRPASHGCIRLAPEHAAQFYRLVQQHGASRVAIHVVGVAPIGVAGRADRSQGARAARSQSLGSQASLGGPSRLVVRRYDGAGNAYWAGPERFR